MLIRDFLPAPAMREFVQWYRIVHFEFDKDENIPFKAYPPKPEQCLHFFLHDPLAIEKTGDKKSLQPLIFFAGQRTSLVKQFNSKDNLNVQIVFQPTAVYRLTKIPAFELTDQNVDATCIFPKHIQFVYEQLQSAKDYAELLHIIDSFAQELIFGSRKENLPIDFISKQMIQKGGNISMDWLAKESCLCTKQFKRKFFERTGVNPKTYARIIRFNRVYNYKNRFPNKDWSAIALECGYFDYQHLAKDYKDFTGLTPPEFHLMESKSPENTLGLTKSLYHYRFQATY